jgi:hypothetical protein
MLGVLGHLFGLVVELRSLAIEGNCPLCKFLFHWLGTILVETRIEAAGSCINALGILFEYHRSFVKATANVDIFLYEATLQDRLSFC